MKIRIAVMSAVIILLSHTTVFASPTEKRNVMDFCESYMKRYVSAVKDAGNAFSVYTFGSSVLAEFSDIYILSVTAGNLEVYKDDLLISEGSFVFTDAPVNSEKTNGYLMNFIAALSSLEFDSMEDQMRETEGKITGDSKSCFVESMEICNDIIMPKLTTSAFEDAKNGDEVMVYSGNYDYYLEYREIKQGDRNYSQYWIIAKAHE